MKRLIGWLFPFTAMIVALIGPREAYAAFRIGETLNHSLSVCLKKEDAIAILDLTTQAVTLKPDRES